jgi:hypothetical protein
VIGWELEGVRDAAQLGGEKRAELALPL